MGEAIRILCVDDEKNVLRALARLFLDDEYEIMSASSGDEGLAVLREISPVQIVISDYRMPGMNGVDFLREVCRLWPDTVRIVLSGYADTAAIVSAVNDGQIYKFVPKPWNDDELKITVANAVERYSLHKRNIELAEEIRRSNEELKALNESFERLVDEKINELLVQNSLLSCAQNILESLPVAVVGTNADGLIVLCNRKGNEFFLEGRGLILGMDRRDALPQAVNDLFGRIDGTMEAAGTIVARGKRLRARGTGVVYPDGAEGAVVVFDREEP